MAKAKSKAAKRPKGRKAAVKKAKPKKAVARAKKPAKKAVPRKPTAKKLAAGAAPVSSTAGAWPGLPPGYFDRVR